MHIEGSQVIIPNKIVFLFLKIWQKVYTLSSGLMLYTWHGPLYILRGHRSVLALAASHKPATIL